MYRTKPLRLSFIKIIETVRKVRIAGKGMEDKVNKSVSAGT